MARLRRPASPAGGQWVRDFLLARYRQAAANLRESSAVEAWPHGFGGLHDHLIADLEHGRPVVVGCGDLPPDVQPSRQAWPYGCIPRCQVDPDGTVTPVMGRHRGHDAEVIMWEPVTADA